MKQRTLKAIVSLLSVFLILTVSFSSAFAVESGNCGTNAKWTFDSDSGELTISGSGSITSYSSADYVPWKTYTDRITKITIEEGITKIGNYSFKNCSHASELTISDGVTEIGYSAFDNCTSLTEVTVPSSVEKINDAPFYGCTALTEISVESDNENYCSDDNGVLYNKEKTELIQYPSGKSTANFSIPDTVTNIKAAAFASNKSILNIFVSESVNMIDSMAFYECTSLTAISLPESITLIGEMAFSKCDNLSDVYYAGTQEKWKNIAVRDNNTPLLSASFKYETTGSETLPDEEVQTTSDVNSVANNADYNKIVEEKLKNNIDLIPAILIGIAVTVLILIIILIRVIVKKHPDDHNK